MTNADKIKSLVAEKRAEIARLREALSRHTCDGMKYSLPEDVETVDRIETLEEEIAALEKQL